MNNECETGIVVRKEGDVAIIETEPVSSCKSCGSKGRCMFSESEAGVKRQIRASAPFEVSVGQRVHFELRISMLRISFIFYLVPAIFLFLGFYGGYYYLPLFANRDFNSLVGGAAAFVLSFCVIFLVSRIINTSHNTHAVITQTVDGD